MKRIIIALVMCIIATLIVSSVMYFAVYQGKYSFLETMGIYYPVGIFIYLLLERDKRERIMPKNKGTQA